MRGDRGEERQREGTQGTRRRMFIMRTGVWGAAKTRAEHMWQRGDRFS